MRTPRHAMLLFAALVGVTTLGIAAAAPCRAALSSAPPASAPGPRPYDAEIVRRVTEVHADVIAWRRGFHQYPELSNREVRTSKAVAEKLREMGLEVKTGIAKHGVVAVLRGARPGPVVALRADMDALPVTEEVDVPFASKARGEYEGREVGVMHACGHDAHTAMLLGTARVLTAMKSQLKGTVKFIFQPCEEGAPTGEEGGARVMVAEGVLRDPAPEAVFGMHVTNSDFRTLGYRPEGELAASDRLRIVVRGRQTHGGRPWEGIDPIVVGAQIVLGLQTIVSRQSDITLAPVVLSIGSLHGGVRNNIIPDSLVMEGTLRTYDTAMRDSIVRRIHRTAEDIAASAGAVGRVEILDSNPVTWNDAALTARMAPTLARVAGARAVRVIRPRTYSEDFAYYAREVPGFYVFLGVNPPGVDEASSAPNHSPRFFVDENALDLGVRTMSTLAVDYLMSGRESAAASTASRNAKP